MANRKIVFTGFMATVLLMSNAYAATKIASKDYVDFQKGILQGSIQNKADKSTTYTKTEVDTALDDKADKLTTSANVEIATVGTDGQYTRSGMTLGDLQAATGDVTNKADKVTSATAGNLAGLDATGNITDSGVKAADFATTNALTTGLSGKEDVSNRVTTIAAPAYASDAKYPTEKATSDALFEVNHRVSLLDNAVQDKANTSAVNNALATKQDKLTNDANAGDNITIDADGKISANVPSVDLTSYAKSSDVDGALLLKADKSDTYTKAEVDAGVGAVATRVTTAEGNITNLQTNKQDKLTNDANAGDNITIDADGKISANVPSVDLTPYAKTETVDAALLLKADGSTVSALATTVDGKADKLNTSANVEIATVGTDGQYTRSGMTLGDLQAATGDVTNKADKVTSATAGNLAGLDATGNITDSGVKVADFATASDLANKASVSDVNDALADKADKSDTYTKTETNAEIESYALPKPDAKCLGAQSQCVLAVDKDTGTIYWEDVAIVTP